LLSALKLARAAQRRRKKVNRRAAKAKAGRQQQETGGEEVTQSLGIGGALETAAPPAQSRDQPAPEASLDSRSAGMTVDTVAVSEATSDTVRTWRDRLMTVYTANNPSKVRDIDDILAKYQGQEGILYLRVCKKYNVQPDDECSLAMEATQQQWQQMQQVYTQAVGMINDMTTSTTRGEDSQQPGEAAPSLLQETEPPPLKQVRIEENTEMDGCQSESAFSRTSQHSMSTTTRQSQEMQAASTADTAARTQTQHTLRPGRRRSRSKKGSKNI